MSEGPLFDEKFESELLCKFNVMEKNFLSMYTYI